MTIHKKITAQDFEDAGYLELARTYLNMGLREEAAAQFRILAQQYKSSGMEDKALRLMALMARIDVGKPGAGKSIPNLSNPIGPNDGGAANAGSEKASPREVWINAKGNEAYLDLGAELAFIESGKTRTHKEIEKTEQARGCPESCQNLRMITSTNSRDSNSNYSLGLARLESGLIDDAVQQFQIAYEKGDNQFEAARLLGLCFKEKAMWTEAVQAFEKAVKAGGTCQADTLAVKSQMSLIFKEQGKTEEALKLFREESSVEDRFPKGTMGVNRRTKKSVRK